MAFPRPSKPSVLLADLRAFLSGAQRHRLLFGALAMLMPLVIIYGFQRDAHTNILPGPSITYIQSWPADRSDAEIKAQQKIDQKKKEVAALERQRSYQRLAKQLGIE